jgi:hypothetical protein
MKVLMKYFGEESGEEDMFGSGISARPDIDRKDATLVMQMALNPLIFENYAD